MGIADLFSGLGLKRFPKVWLVDGISQPFVWGLLRGGIYLPANFVKVSSAEHRRGILGHELSHVLRFDAAVNLLQTIAQAVFWFHPFVWWANKRIRAEREKCCDEMAIARLNAQVKEYSSAIVETLITEHESTRPVPSLAVAGPVRNIEERIKTIMKPGKKFHKRPSLPVAAIVMFVALLAVPTVVVLTTRAETKTASQSDRDSLQGMWVGHETGRESRCKMIVSDNQIEFHIGSEEWYEGKFTLRDKTEPKQLDILILNCTSPFAIDKTSRAIYKLEKERLTVVASMPGLKTRPTSFGGAPGGRVFVLTKSQEPQTEFARSLHQAASIGDLEQVRILLAKGVDMDEPDAMGWTPLQYAAQRGHTDIAKLLIAKGADVKVKTKSCETVLYYAAANRQEKLVELLLTKGADVNVALHCAAAHGRVDAAKLLLAQGANINAKDDNGMTPVYAAAMMCHKEVVELLVAKGANVNVSKEGVEPAYAATTMLGLVNQNRMVDTVNLLLAAGAEVDTIHFAAFVGDVEKIKSFLARGIDVNAKDGFRRTPLHLAAISGQKDVLRFLIGKGADVNANEVELLMPKGITPLHLAIMNSDYEVTKLLLDNGADVSAKTGTTQSNFLPPFRFSPLWVPLMTIGLKMEFAFMGTPQLDMEGAMLTQVTQLMNKLDETYWPRWRNVVELLLERGANVNERAFGGMTLLHLAASVGLTDAAGLLIAHGADVNAKGDKGQTPLHMAIDEFPPGFDIDKKGTVKLLIAKGADVNAKDRDGGTALWYAQEAGQTDIAEVLRKHGAKEEAPKISLHRIVTKGNVKQVQSLLAKGADINKKNKQGETPLYVAVKRDDKAMVEFLVAEGADIDAKNKDGQTPLHIAARQGHKYVAALLIERGAHPNAKNRWNRTPLDIAIDRGHKEIVELLNKQERKKE
jgi:uncharacterized protein (TIGR03067 family)